MGLNTLKKSEIIRLDSDFDKISALGKKKYTKHFLIIALKNNLAQSRFAVRISRKVGKANIRNIWKRQIRELWRLNKQSIKKGYDFLIVVKHSSKETDKREIPAIIKQELRKLGYR